MSYIHDIVNMNSIQRSQRDFLNNFWNEYVPYESKSFILQCDCCGRETIKAENKIKRNKHNFCCKKCHYVYKKGVKKGGTKLGRIL
jgi:transposase-like protein